VGTAFINDRFAKLVTGLLSELTAKTKEVGIEISVQPPRP
jgi:hypothetical protein